MIKFTSQPRFFQFHQGLDKGFYGINPDFKYLIIIFFLLVTSLPLLSSYAVHQWIKISNQRIVLRMQSSTTQLISGKFSKGIRNGMTTAM